MDLDKTVELVLEDTNIHSEVVYKVTVDSKITFLVEGEKLSQKLNEVEVTLKPSSILIQRL